MAIAVEKHACIQEKERKRNFIVFLVHRVLIISFIYRSVPVPDLLLRIQPEHEKETQR